eukprot:COSAG01_NODE_11223_length_1979_cov_1.535106_2_plen_458_part_00
MFVLFVNTNDAISSVSYSAGRKFQLLSWPYDFDSIWRTMRTMLRVHFGDFSFDFEGAQHAQAAYVMFGVFLGLVLVLMMNLLIAVLSGEHAKVAGNLEKEYAMKRVGMLMRLRVRMENDQLPPPLNLIHFPMKDNLSRRRVAWICWLLLAVPVLIVTQSLVLIVATVILAAQPHSARMAIQRLKVLPSGMEKLLLKVTNSNGDRTPTKTYVYCRQLIMLSILIVMGPVLIALYACKNQISAWIMIVKMTHCNLHGLQQRTLNKRIDKKKAELSSNNSSAALNSAAFEEKSHSNRTTTKNSAELGSAELSHSNRTTTRVLVRQTSMHEHLQLLKSAKQRHQDQKKKPNHVGFARLASHATGTIFGNDKEAYNIDNEKIANKLGWPEAQDASKDLYKVICTAFKQAEVAQGTTENCWDQIKELQLETNKINDKLDEETKKINQKLDRILLAMKKNDTHE